MIDIKTEPLLVGQITGISIPLAARTALLFRILAVLAATLAALLPLAVALYWLVIDREGVLSQTGFAPKSCRCSTRRCASWRSWSRC